MLSLWCSEFVFFLPGGWGLNQATSPFILNPFSVLLFSPLSVLSCGGMNTFLFSGFVIISVFWDILQLYFQILLFFFCAASLC